MKIFGAAPQNLGIRVRPKLPSIVCFVDLLSLGLG
jgi:hypothetical protein